jgi:sulfate permease, SulP family
MSNDPGHETEERFPAQSPRSQRGGNWAVSLLPILQWLPAYRRDDIAGDLMGGAVVAIMLVPQAMAYAMLAGLPPQAGLYASLLPLVLYAMLGSSRVLAVGPVAMVSLLTASTLAPLASEAGDYASLALSLALLAGLLQLAMGIARLGFLVNFLSHPVISGFTSAAALVIGLSQAKHLLGTDFERTEHPYRMVAALVQRLPEANPATLVLAAGSVAILLVFQYRSEGWLRRARVASLLATAVAKSGPLVAVLAATLLVAAMGLEESFAVNVVGDVPAGLPRLTLPGVPWDRLGALSKAALVIVFVGYMESIAIAKALASRRRQKVDPDQELIALGAANVGASLTGGYPVTGGFSRSVVNSEAGARTPLASVITAGLVALTVAFLTPMFYYIPHAVLAAVIIVAVASLVDWRMPLRLWRSNKTDAVALLVTFVAVLALGIETGILAGVGTSLGLFLWRTSRPHIAVVGRVGDSEHFRNVNRHQVRTHPAVLAVRVDESLYFANARYLGNSLLDKVAEHPAVEHLLLVGSGINDVDASAVETLRELIEGLQGAGVAFHLAEIKGPVLDQLRRSGLIDELGEDHVFLSTHEAMAALTADRQNRRGIGPPERAGA